MKVNKVTLLLSLLAVTVAFTPANAQLVLGSFQTSNNAQLIINNPSKGLLIPRLSILQRNAISGAPNGLQVYTTDNNAFYHYNGTNWIRGYDSINNPWHKNGNYLFNPIVQKIGLNTSTPLGTLHLFNSLINGISFTDGVTGTGNFDGASLLQSSDGTIDFSNLENFSYHFGTNGIERLTLDNLGNLGINNTNPTDPLSFQRTTGEKINFANQTSTQSYGIGVQGARIEIHTGSNTAPVQFGFGKTGNGGVEQHLEIIGSGNIGNGSVNLNGRLMRVASNGPADLLPIAYGKVDASGALLSGTSNVTITGSGIGGEYLVSVFGEDLSNTTHYNIMVTPTMSGSAFNNFKTVEISPASGGAVRVILSDYRISYSNRSCGLGNTVCLAMLNFLEYADSNDPQGFNFIIYKF